ncbi:MAG: CoA pyrophosphatase [Deltaproteobacteria bacterium]|nr:CoA pyrophosphatase [Deltaproteobacteria bacterium]
MKKDLTERIQKALDRRRPGEVANDNGCLIHAAVLIPLFETEKGYEVVFTERTHRVEHHKGQISFPGGAVEDCDRDYEETALRETYEEIGVLPDDVKVLGRLDDELTVASNFIVHPFVGKIPYPYEFVLNRDEVERLITVPVELFFHENSHLHPRSIDFDTFIYKGPAYRYEEITIWGATAIIMHKFMGLIGSI